MRRSIKMCLGALASAVVVGVAVPDNQALAQSSGTVTANGGGTVITGVQIHKERDLEFGALVASATSGTVVVTPESSTTRSATGGVTLTDQGNLTPASGEFRVTGNPNFTYTITLPNSATLTVSGGTATMTVDNFTKSNQGPQLNGQGTETWWAGATLNVGADQTAGRYEGTFDVGVAYN